MQDIWLQATIGKRPHSVRRRGANEMLKTEHREPPNGSHSMASAGHPGWEVAVFPGSPGVLAYPSYVVTYMTPLCEDPWVRVERGRVERGRVERGELGHATLYQMRSISEVNNVTMEYNNNRDNA